jgi:hypothetical protein
MPFTINPGDHRWYCQLTELSGIYPGNRSLDEIGGSSAASTRCLIFEHPGETGDFQFFPYRSRRRLRNIKVGLLNVVDYA